MKEYNLKGIQVRRSCTRYLLHSSNKFDTSSINDVPIQKLFITNLDKKTTEEDLSKFFKHFGKVEECIIKKNKKSNYAFVTFTKVESALQALKNTNRLHDKDLTVIPADSSHQPGYQKKEKKVLSDLKEKNIEQSCSSSSSKVYPLVHRISDNCLKNIFQYLPIVDRVKVERVCRRWRDLSLDSWRTMRRLDVNSSSWGCKCAEIGSSDLYQVLKRCGRFITIITFFEQHQMMSLRTLFIIGKLCPHLKIAYLGTLEVTPREISFLLSQCLDLEFLEFDNFHFCDQDFSEIFAKSKKLKFLRIEESRIEGSCFIYLPEEIETIVFHNWTIGVNHFVFHSVIQKLKNLQNLYLGISQNDDYNSLDFVEHEMGIPVFDDGDDSAGDFEYYIPDDYDSEENSAENYPQDDDFNDNDSYEKDEYDLYVEYNHEEQEEEDNFGSEEVGDFNDISSTITDDYEEKDDNQASTSKDENQVKLENTDTSITKASYSKTSDAKTSDSKESVSKSSNDMKDDNLESKASYQKDTIPISDSSDILFESNPSTSYDEDKQVMNENENINQSNGNRTEAIKKQHNKSTDNEEMLSEQDELNDFDNYEYVDIDDKHVDYDDMYLDNVGNEYGDYDDFFDDYDNYDDYDHYDDYDDYDHYDDYDDYDHYDDYNFQYESNLANTIKETIRNCNKNLKILQLKRCNPAGLTSTDLISNFTNFTSLERLDVSRMKIVNDELLSTIGANCPKLSVLIINACDSVTDIGIGGIALLPELKHLSMTDLPNIVGKHLETVCSLKTLYCARCTALQEGGIDQLILNSHELEQLDIQMCKSVTNALMDIALVAIQSRTNNIKLRIFAKGSGVDITQIEGNSELLEILMERRCEEQDSFVDGDFGTEEIGLAGDLRLRDFRGMIFEKSTSDSNKG